MEGEGRVRRLPIHVALGEEPGRVEPFQRTQLLQLLVVASYVGLAIGRERSDMLKLLDRYVFSRGLTLIVGRVGARTSALPALPRFSCPQQ